MLRQLLPRGLVDNLALGRDQHGVIIGACPESHDSAPGQPCVERVNQTVVQEAYLDAERGCRMAELSKRIWLHASRPVRGAVGQGRELRGPLWANARRQIQHRR